MGVWCLKEQGALLSLAIDAQVKVTFTNGFNMNKGARMEYPEELYDHTSPAYKDAGKVVELTEEELDKYLAQSSFSDLRPDEEKSATDLVNHPPHYTSGGIETIDYMEAKSTPEEFKGHLRLTALKYLSRVGMKDDILQEYEKAEWYTKKLIETIKKERGML